MAFYKYLLILLCLPGHLVAQGGFIIGSGAHVVNSNNPKIVIRDGHFKNDGNFSAGNSTVLITGSTATENSTIGGMAITTFHHLTIAKSNHNVRLDFDIQVNGDLTMDGGLLILNYSDIELGGNLLDETELTRITGTEGGAIYKTVLLDQPFEANPGNLGAVISSGANLGTTIIRRSHVQQESEGGYGIYRNYEIIPANNTNLDATLRFHYFDAELTDLAEEKLAIWRQNNGTWHMLGAESSSTVDNWVEVSGIGFFDMVTLAENLISALPVELLHFDAVAVANRKVDLFWSTASETDNDYFTIERSADGVRFEPITRVDGAGTSSKVLHYQAVDPSPYPGVSYYRLRQTDFDGTWSFSAVKSVEITSGPGAYTVYPNPLNKVLHITGEGMLAEPTIISLFDAAGKLILDQRLEPDAQRISVEVREVSKLPAGRYLLLIRAKGESHSFNLVKVQK